MTLSELDCSSINFEAILHGKRQGPGGKTLAAVVTLYLLLDVSAAEV